MDKMDRCLEILRLLAIKPRTVNDLAFYLREPYWKTWADVIYLKKKKRIMAINNGVDKYNRKYALF